MRYMHTKDSPDDKCKISSFNIIKDENMSASEVSRTIHDFAAGITVLARSRDGSVNLDMLDSAGDAASQVDSLLHKLLERLCDRARAVTAVVEPYHMDDVYKDLTAAAYSREFFDAGRWAIRLSFFAAALTADQFFLMPGRFEDWEETGPRVDSSGRQYPPLQDLFVGAVVIEPRAGGVVGNTLLSPVWVASENIHARLSDFDLTIRGKRLRVQAFPWREQDSDVLSCAETTAMSIATYFANEYDEYPRALPAQMLESIERTIDGRTIQTQGLDFEELRQLLSHVGFRTRHYEVSKMTGDAVLGEATGPTRRLWKVARSYIDSGIPFAVNVQPEGEGVGHSMVVVGLSADPGYGTWDAQQDYAVRVEGPLGKKGRPTTLEVMDVADLEQSRRVCVIDDRQLPYSCQNWSMPSVFLGMSPTEILVPNAPQMCIGALDAKEIAWEIFRSPKHGLAASLPGSYEDGERIVMTQQMVSVRSYLRFRVATCDPSISSIWEACAFPRYAWLFECVRLRDWKPDATRESPQMSCAELLIDCTASALGEPTSHIVLLRYPGLLHYHGPDGHGITCSKDVAVTFPSYTRNLRRISIHRLDCK